MQWFYYNLAVLLFFLLTFLAVTSFLVLDELEMTSDFLSTGKYDCWCFLCLVTFLAVRGWHIIRSILTTKGKSKEFKGNQRNQAFRNLLKIGSWPASQKASKPAQTARKQQANKSAQPASKPGQIASKQIRPSCHELPRSFLEAFWIS